VASSRLVLLQIVGAVVMEVKRTMAVVMILEAAAEEVTKPYKIWWCSMLKCGAVGQWANWVNGAPSVGQTLSLHYYYLAFILKYYYI
jgi:hypothetical protein